MPKVIVLGTTGDITTCECCGKSELKKTVALEVDGEVQYYGTTCAGNALARWNFPGTIPAGPGWPNPMYDPTRLRQMTQRANNERRLTNRLAVAA
jgi:hypothetical protein